MENQLTADIDAVNRPYWEALAQGRLTFQACSSCGHCWLPARTACPKCLSRDCSWKEASGHGKILSWVVYHVAYHPAFADRLPYNVAIVELQEGPRLLSNVLCDAEELQPYAPVSLIIEKEGDAHVPRFTLATAGSE